MGLSHLHGVVLYTETTEELSIFIRAASNVSKNPANQCPFHAPAFYTRVERFLGELTAVFFDHRIDSALQFVQFFNMIMSHTHTTSILVLQMFSSCIRLHSYYHKTEEGGGKARSEGHQRKIIRAVQKIILDSDPAPPESLLIRKAICLTPPTF